LGGCQKLAKISKISKISKGEEMGSQRAPIRIDILDAASVVERTNSVRNCDPQIPLEFLGCDAASTVGSPLLAVLEILEILAGSRKSPRVRTELVASHHA